MLWIDTRIEVGTIRACYRSDTKIEVGTIRACYRSVTDGLMVIRSRLFKPLLCLSNHSLDQS